MITDTYHDIRIADAMVSAERATPPCYVFGWPAQSHGAEITTNSGIPGVI